MSVIDLHPEELLERAAGEPLSASDQAHLEAHLDSCVACRLLQLAREDFRDERETYERPAIEPVELAPEVLQELTRQARGRRTASQPPAPRAAHGGRLGLGQRSQLTLLAAAVVLVGSVAAASGWVGNLWRSTAGTDGTAEPSAPVVARTATPPLSEWSRTLGAGAVPEAPEPEPVEALPATEPPVTAAPPSAAMVPDRPLPATQAASTLFDDAGRARRAGRYDEALQLYRQLQRRFPESEEARASRATVARLLLDTGRAEAVLADYDEYLADGGAPLTEEAMVGRARAYQRLAQQAAERAAWQTLLRQFPESLHADHARARLQTLDNDGQE